MANNNLETYHEAILDKIADGTETNIPRPSWNIEKYLAAIYEACSSGGGGGSAGGGVLVVTETLSGGGEVGTLNKNFTEITAAMKSGGVVIETTDGFSKVIRTVVNAIDAGFAFLVIALDISGTDGSVSGYTFTAQTATGTLTRGGMA